MDADRPSFWGRYFAMSLCPASGASCSGGHFRLLQTADCARMAACWIRDPGTRTQRRQCDSDSHANCTRTALIQQPHHSRQKPAVSSRLAVLLCCCVFFLSSIFPFLFAFRFADGPPFECSCTGACLCNANAARKRGACACYTRRGTCAYIIPNDTLPSQLRWVCMWLL